MFVDNFEGRVGEKKKKKERKEAMDTTQIYFFFLFIFLNLIFQRNGTTTNILSMTR